MTAPNPESETPSACTWQARVADDVANHAGRVQQQQRRSDAVGLADDDALAGGPIYEGGVQKVEH